MNIDWFTFAMQIINFLVLVALLRHFLYGRIVAAMHEREQRIAARWEEAEQKRGEAEAEAESYRDKNASLDERRERILEEAQQDAEATRKRLLAEAREQAEQKRRQWLESLDRQRESLLQLVRERTGEQALAAARQALAELADVELEQRMVDVFLQRFEALDDRRREELRQAVQQDSRPVTIRSAFEISAERQERLREAIHGPLGVTGEMHFKIAPDVICGIELQAGGRKVGWSAEQFLASLEEELAGMLSSKS